jgi:hypothetical protein
MKIYSYKINIDIKYQEAVQSRPFLNCVDETVIQDIISYLKSENLEISQIETKNKKNFRENNNLFIKK